MPTRRLFNLTVPAVAQTRESGRTQGRRQVAQLGNLNGQGQTQGTGVQPNSQRLVGQYRGQYADKMTTEVEELFRASGFEEVAYFAPGTSERIDGYYTLRDIDADPIDPRSTNLAQFDGRLNRAGTRRSHWRATATNPDDVDNPFGAGASEEIAIPATAEKPRWFNPPDQSLADATVQRTETTRLGDVDIYDATEPAFGSPTLIYDVPYDNERVGATRVWDDYGRSKVVILDEGDVVGTATVGSQTVGEGRRVDPTWQKVFATDHDDVGALWIENGLIRLHVDDVSDARSLRFYEWDTADEHWGQTSLGSSDWRLYDANLREIRPVRAVAQIEFQDTANPSTRYNLNAILHRGRTTVQFVIPPNQSGSLPSGLDTRLSPIAAASDRDPVPVHTIVQRSETDR